MKARARVTVTVELTVSGENWNQHTSIEQLHREAGELGLDRIRRLCERYVVIIGKPKVEAILTEDK